MTPDRPASPQAGAGDASGASADEDADNDVAWLIDMEIAMVKSFGWSLRDIDETDIESLLPFVFRLTESNEGKQDGRLLYADEVNWL